VSNVLVVKLSVYLGSIFNWKFRVFTKSEWIRKSRKYGRVSYFIVRKDIRNVNVNLNVEGNRGDFFLYQVRFSDCL
jgi:hypothetical protein